MIINNRYRIIRKLGQGRSAVFLCSDSFFDGNKVALKVLGDTAAIEEREQFRTEFFLHRNFSHPNITEVFESGLIFAANGDDFDIKTDSIYFTSEYFDGIPLNDLERPKESALINCIVQICSALQYLHQSNYIYFDLKEQNVLMGRKNGLVKIIDFGLTGKVNPLAGGVKKGSVEYISPEIISGEVTDHRTDLYSLGVLIYKQIYSKYPFDSENDLSIYKQKISGDVKFPSCDYSPRLIQIVRKLLSRNPSARYFTALEVVGELNEISSVQFSKLIFTSSFYAGSAFTRLIQKVGAGAINSLLLKGAAGSGKSCLLKHFESIFDYVVFLSPENFQHELEPFKWIEYQLKKVCGFDVLTKAADETYDSLGSFFNLLYQVIANVNLTVIIDDYDKFSDYLKNILFNVVRFCQINDIRLLVAVDANSGDLQSVRNLSVFTIWPLKKNEISGFISNEIGYFLPRDSIISAAEESSDRTPGALKNFINELILNRLIILEAIPPAYVRNKKILDLISDKQNELIKLGIELLDSAELELIRTLSLFESAPSLGLLRNVYEGSKNALSELLVNMQNKGLLKEDKFTGRIHFVNPRCIDAVKNSIQHLADQHLSLAKKLNSQKLPVTFSEIYFQYEQAGKFNSCFQLLNTQLSKTEFAESHSYQKMLIERLLRCPVENEIRNRLLEKLSSILLNIGEYADCLKIVHEIEESGETVNSDSITRIKGEALIGVGNPKEGIDLLNAVSNRFGENDRLDVLLVIAGAMLDLNRYSDTLKYCRRIEKAASVSEVTRGKCLILESLVGIHQNEDFESAKLKFSEAENLFAQSGRYNEQASVAVNLGNIFNIEGDTGKAAEYWNEALKLTRITGNIEKETQILMNKGILEFENCRFETASEHYKRARNIFLTLGNKSGEGLACSNLGELFTYTCEYSEAWKNLERANSIFSHIKNREEQTTVFQHKIYLYNELQFNEERNAVILQFGDKIQANQIPQKYEYLFDFWKIYKDIGDTEGASNQFIKLMDAFKKCVNDDDLFQTASISVHYMNLLLLYGRWEELSDCLNRPELNVYLKFNAYFNAYENYFLAMLSQHQESMDDMFRFLENSFSLLSDISITELTWKVLIELVFFFKDRGDKRRSEDYLWMANDVMSFIVSNLSELDLVDKYLENYTRAKIISRLEELEGEIISGG